MNLSIGEKIKNLRKEQDVTQEKLADYLNISYQAVSKWENGTTLPDISMIIPLANFFGVTTDELFDMDTQRQTQEIADIEAEYSRLSNKGLLDERITLMREAVAKYPNNYTFIMGLANALQKENSSDEVIAICERILEDCNDNGIRGSAIQTLTYTYCYLENWEKAKEYANKSNSVWICSEMLLCSAATGKERTEIAQQFVSSLMDIMDMRLRYTIAYDNEDDRIFAYETALKMWQLLFYDENYLFYHVRFFEIHSWLAKAYAKKSDKAKALEHLAAAKKHGTLYESVPEGTHNYTSIFANTWWHNKEKTTKNTPNTVYDNLKTLFKEECFGFIRDDPEFTALI